MHDHMWFTPLIYLDFECDDHRRSWLCHLIGGFRCVDHRMLGHRWDEADCFHSRRFHWHANLTQWRTLTKVNVIPSSNEDNEPVQTCLLACTPITSFIGSTPIVRCVRRSRTTAGSWLIPLLRDSSWLRTPCSTRCRLIRTLLYCTIVAHSWTFSNKQIKYMLDEQEHFFLRIRTFLFYCTPVVTRFRLSFRPSFWHRRGGLLGLARAESSSIITSIVSSVIPSVVTSVVSSVIPSVVSSVIPPVISPIVTSIVSSIITEWLISLRFTLPRVTCRSLVTR
jgi:hypothetical protein